MASAAPGDPRRADSAPIAGTRARIAGPPSIPPRLTTRMVVGTTSLVRLHPTSLTEPSKEEVAPREEHPRPLLTAALEPTTP